MTRERVMSVLLDRDVCLSGVVCFSEAAPSDCVGREVCIPVTLGLCCHSKLCEYWTFVSSNLS